eukprot:1946713-Karenia_brevis.AAC.1
MNFAHKDKSENNAHKPIKVDHWKTIEQQTKINAFNEQIRQGRAEQQISQKKNHPKKDMRRGSRC